MDSEVSSNGKTVWLNIEGACRGRFCPVSAEYTDSKGMPIGLDVPPNWEDFVKKCSDLFGVDPSTFEGHRPHWLQTGGLGWTDTKLESSRRPS